MIKAKKARPGKKEKIEEMKRKLCNGKEPIGSGKGDHRRVAKDGRNSKGTQKREVRFK